MIPTWKGRSWQRLRLSISSKGRAVTFSKCLLGMSLLYWMCYIMRLLKMALSISGKGYSVFFKIGLDPFMSKIDPLGSHYYRARLAEWGRVQEDLVAHRKILQHGFRIGFFLILRDKNPFKIFHGPKAFLWCQRETFEILWVFRQILELSMGKKKKKGFRDALARDRGVCRLEKYFGDQLWAHFAVPKDQNERGWVKNLKLLRKHEISVKKKKKKKKKKKQEKGRAEEKQRKTKIKPRRGSNEKLSTACLTQYQGSGGIQAKKRLKLWGMVLSCR